MLGADGKVMKTRTSRAASSQACVLFGVGTAPGGTSGGMPLRLEESASCACGSDRLAVMATGSEMMCLSYPPGGRSLGTTVERLGWWGWREASRHGLEQLLAARGSASKSHRHRGLCRRRPSRLRAASRALGGDAVEVRWAVTGLSCVTLIVCLKLFRLHITLIFYFK